MGNKWKETTLGEILTLQRGYDLPRQKRVRGTIPIVSSSGISDYHNKAAVICPGVVTGRYGTIGKIFYIDSDYWPLNTTLYVKDFKGNDPKFIYYLLKTVDFHQFNDKSSVPGVNRNHAHTAKVYITNIQTQRRIAAILSAFDEKIELSRQMNRTLEQMARALFKSWFVDFDPVRAKMRGEQPIGMDSETAALFPDALEEIEGREIPKGWEVGQLNQIIRFNPSLKLQKGNAATYLDMGNMPTSSMSANGWYQRTYKSGTRFQNGDTLFARITPCLENGKVALVDFLDQDEIGWGSTEYIVMRPNQYTPHIYPYILCRSEEFRKFAIGNMNGSSGRQRVSHQSLGNYPIIIPENHIWQLFDQLTSPIVYQTTALRNESQTLAQLRDALLPKLLSGEIDVSEWEDG